MYARLIDVGRLVALRADRGMTIRALSRASGVSYSMLKYVHKGERQLSDVTATRVAKALDCSVEDFSVPKSAPLRVAS